MADPLEGFVRIDAPAATADPLEGFVRIEEAPAPTDFMGRLGAAAQAGARGVVAGVKETVGAIPGIAQAVIGAPRQIGEDLAALLQDPGTAIPEQAERAKRFAAGMIPMIESIRKVVRGEPLDVESVSKEMTMFATSLGLAKGVGTAVKRGTKLAVRKAPGAGVELQEMAASQAAELAKRLTPEQAEIRAAFQAVEKMGNPTLRVDNLRKVAGDIIAHEGGASRPNTALIAQAQKILDTSADGWSWQRATSEVRRIGQQLGESKKVTGEIPKELDDIYTALRTDVDVAKPAPGFVGAHPAEGIAQSRAWGRAQKIARRGFAAEELANQINQATGVAGEGFVSFNPNRVVKWIEQQQRAASLAHGNKSAKRFIESWKPEELADIKRTLREIKKNMGVLPPAGGTPVGSSRNLLRGAVGGGAAGAMGGDIASGAVIGVVGLEMISKLLQTQGGRAFVRRTMQVRPVTSPAFNQAAAAWLRAEQTEEEQE